MESELIDFSRLEFILGDENNIPNFDIPPYFVGIPYEDQKSDNGNNTSPPSSPNEHKKNSGKRCREVYNADGSELTFKKKIDKNKINRTFYYYSIDNHLKKIVIRENVARCIPGPAEEKSVAILNKSNNLMLLELSDRIEGSYYVNSSNSTDQLLVIDNPFQSSSQPNNIFGSLVKQRIHKTLLPKVHIVDRRNERLVNSSLVYTTTNLNLTKQHMMENYLNYSGYLAYAYGSEDYIQRSVFNRWDSETISIVLYSTYLFLLDSVCMYKHKNLCNERCKYKHNNLCSARSATKILFMSNMDFFLDMFFDQVEVVRKSIFLAEDSKNKIHCAGVVNNFQINEKTVDKDLLQEYSLAITTQLSHKFEIDVFSVILIDCFKFINNDKLWRHGVTHFEQFKNLKCGRYTFIFFSPYWYDRACGLKQALQESYVIYTRV